MLAGFGFALPTGGLNVTPAALLIGFAAGVTTTWLAARSAARRAGRVAPIEALRATATAGKPLTRRRIAAALATLAGAAGLGVAGVTIPTATLFVVAGGGVAAGAIAAWRPARRAARVDMLEAIATT